MDRLLLHITPDKSYHSIGIDADTLLNSLELNIPDNDFKFFKKVHRKLVKNSLESAALIKEVRRTKI